MKKKKIKKAGKKKAAQGKALAAVANRKGTKKALTDATKRPRTWEDADKAVEARFAVTDKG